jgi:hypothetical protein
MRKRHHREVLEEMLLLLLLLLKPLLANTRPSLILPNEEQEEQRAFVGRRVLELESEVAEAIITSRRGRADRAWSNPWARIAANAPRKTVAASSLVPPLLLSRNAREAAPTEWEDGTRGFSSRA